MPRLEFLSKISLFAGLSDSQLKVLASYVREKNYDEGQLIVRDSDVVESLCIVRSGKVKLTKYSSNGKEQIIHIYGEGGMMGLCTMFTDKLFPACAVALEKTCVFHFSREVLEKMAYKEPALLLNLVFALSRRLTESINMIESLSLQKIPQRLASFLLYSKSMTTDTEKIIIPFSRRELARMLGATPETLSRAFNLMKKNGIIQTEGRTVRILDTEALNDIVENTLF